MSALFVSRGITAGSLLSRYVGKDAAMKVFRHVYRTEIL
jgi:hypothetical protein